MVSWIVLIYGVFVAVGGVIGYVKANSMPSLLAGGLSGLALIGASVAMMRGSFSTGWWLALIVSILLIGRFGNNVLSGNYKLMPDVLVVVLGLITVVTLITDRPR